MLVGWDEIAVSNLSNSSVIQPWRGQSSIMDAVYRGYRAVISHGFYLDHMLSAEYHYNNDLKFDATFDKIKQRRILGGEACLWTEYINSNMVHSRLWPRTAAIAERLWSSKYDHVECMYDRLANMDKFFFNPTDKLYMKDLSTLTSNAIALKSLADICEPLGLHGRDRSRNYTNKTPLNRFVDILKSESGQVRQLMKITNLSLLYSTFVSWKVNHLNIETNDTDILQLSENLVQLGQVGIRLLNLIDKNQNNRIIISSRWFYYQSYILNTLEYQVPEIRLAGVQVVKDLLEQFDTCSFDLINLGLVLFFPIIVIFAERINFVRRRILLPALNFCYYTCYRC